MSLTVYIVRRGNGNAGQLGFDWGSVIGSGIQTGVPLLVGAIKGSGQPSQACKPPAGCFQCQMKGQGAIAGCLDPWWITTLPAAKQQLADADLLAFLQQSLAAFQNGSLFTPQSDAYLQNSVRGIQNEISAVQSRLAASSSTIATTTPTTGSTDILGGAGLTSASWSDLTFGGVPLMVVLGFLGVGLGIYAAVKN